jgi:tetratricopeptide (TPR) repeat protein
MKTQWRLSLNHIGHATLLAAAFATGSAWAQTIDDLRNQLDAPWKAKDWPTAEAIAQKIAAMPQSTASDWRNLVNALLNQNKADQAYAASLELVKRPLARSGDHQYICWYLLERNQALKARPDCQKAVDLGGSNYSNFVNLGHTYLLVGDKTQAQSWYQKTLQAIDKEEQLQGPLGDFNLFIQNNWAAADARAAKQWFEQTWPQMQALRSVRDQARDLAKKGQINPALVRLVEAQQQAAVLIGEGNFVNGFWRIWVTLAKSEVYDLVDEKHQHRQAIAWVDQVIQSAGPQLPLVYRLDLLDTLSISRQTKRYSPASARAHAGRSKRQAGG